MDYNSFALVFFHWNCSPFYYDVTILKYEEVNIVIPYIWCSTGYL